MLGDRLAWLLAGRGLPEFYQFAVAAMPAAAMGVLVDRYGALDSRRRPACSPPPSSPAGCSRCCPAGRWSPRVQDGLTGFYITASARLLEVMYLVVGIVVGVTLVLYAGVSLGADLDPDQALRVYDRPWVQLPAAMVLTLAFAVLLQCERGVLLRRHPQRRRRLDGLRRPAPAAPACQPGRRHRRRRRTGRPLRPADGPLPATPPRCRTSPPPSARCCPAPPRTSGCSPSPSATSPSRSPQLTKAAALALALAIGVNLGNEIARM